jgi:hypothetical protein
VPFGARWNDSKPLLNYEGSMGTPLSHTPKKSGSGNRQKQRIVGFRVTADESAKLETAAANKGLTLGSYIRDSLLETPQTRTRRRPLVDVAALSRLLGELNRIGGNINQILKRVNFGETPIGAEFHEALGGHREIIAGIREAMGLGGK